jgi:hypothetical protein
MYEHSVKLQVIAEIPLVGWCFRLRIRVRESARSPPKDPGAREKSRL